jgi:hydrogenase maturation protease
MSDATRPALTIVGCGNLNRCDDGVGVVIARRLAAYVKLRQHTLIQVYDAGTGGMDVMFHARGARRLVLIDACRSGSEPGAVFQVPAEELEREHPPSYSLHDFRWDHALYAGRRIFGADFPTEVTVYLIEAQSLELGCELSLPVIAAADRVSAQLETLIARRVVLDAVNQVYT